MFVNEDAVDMIQQGSLTGWVGAVAADVVEEHGEGAHAKLIHALKLCHERVAVGIVPPYIHARVYGPTEVDAVLAGIARQLTYALCLLLRIRHAPAVAVVEVVLGAIDIGVKLVTAIKIDLSETCLMAPRGAIEALNGATEAHVGPVGHGAALQL